MLVFVLGVLVTKTLHHSISTNKTAAYDPVRFVSCSPHTTAFIFDLGQQHRLLGVSPQGTHPAEAQDWPRVACPDAAPSLGGAAGFHWLGLQNTPARNLYSFEDVFSWMVDVGASIQQTSSTYILIDRIRSDLQRIHAQSIHDARVPRVAFVYPGTSSEGGDQPIWVAGSGTPEHDAVFYARASNAFADQPGYPQVTVAGLLALRPDWVVVHPAARSKLPKQIEALFAVIEMDSSDFVSSRLAWATGRLANHIHSKK